MISAPRTPPGRCPGLCDCPVCTDPLTQWPAELRNPRSGDQWQAVNLQRPEVPRDHVNPGRTVDFAAFDAAMGELRGRIERGES